MWVGEMFGEEYEAGLHELKEPQRWGRCQAQTSSEDHWTGDGKGTVWTLAGTAVCVQGNWQDWPSQSTCPGSSGEWSRSRKNWVILGRPVRVKLMNYISFLVKSPSMWWTRKSFIFLAFKREGNDEVIACSHRDKLEFLIFISDDSTLDLSF